MSFLLLSSGEQLPAGNTFFFSSSEIEVIVGALFDQRHADIKDFQTK